MIKIKIDGRTHEVERDTTILEAAAEVGVVIPTLCNHEMVKPGGQCRVCMTEIIERGRSKMVTACNYPIRKEIQVKTKSAKTRKARALVAEAQLARWPNVPVIREIARAAGVKKARYKHPQQTKKKDACVLCGLCTRACDEAAWERIIGFEGRGASRKVTMPFGRQYERCVGCGACAYICPTGAIKISDEMNNPVDGERIIKWGSKVTQEMATLDPHQCRMRQVGTANIIDVMDAYDLLPTHNFQYGSHEQAKKIYSNVFRDTLLRQNVIESCWPGCSMGCAHVAPEFVCKTGPYKGKKVIVDGPEYENAAGLGANCGIWDPHAILELNFYCDNYGIDTISWGTAMAFAMECFERGIINKKVTGMDLSFGNAKASLACLHQCAKGKGFGVTVGQGIINMRRIFAEKYGAAPDFLHDIGMECKGLEYSEYVSKESIAQQGGYALALKGPQHDEAWLIFMDMVNKQLPTWEMKADALKYFPLFRTWFGLVGLCKLPWNDVTPKNNDLTEAPHKIPSHVEGYCNLFRGVTGKKVTEDDLLLQSERVYNLQKVFCIRQGKGLREDDIPPYRSMGPVTPEEYQSRKDRYDKQLAELVGVEPKGRPVAERIRLLREYRYDQYRQLQDATYKARGWDEDGIPTTAHLKKLGIAFPEVIEVVEKARKRVAAEKKAGTRVYKYS